MRKWTRDNDLSIAAEFAPQCTMTVSYPHHITACLRAISNWQKQDADNRWWIMESPRPGHPGGGYLCELRGGNSGSDVFGEGDTLPEAMAWALYEAVQQ